MVDCDWRQFFVGFINGGNAKIDVNASGFEGWGIDSMIRWDSFFDEDELLAGSNVLCRWKVGKGLRKISYYNAKNKFERQTYMSEPNKCEYVRELWETKWNFDDWVYESKRTGKNYILGFVCSRKNSVGL